MLMVLCLSLGLGCGLICECFILLGEKLTDMCVCCGICIVDLVMLGRKMVVILDFSLMAIWKVV